jgi:hypothetical protein
VAVASIELSGLKATPTTGPARIGAPTSRRDRTSKTCARWSPPVANSFPSGLIASPHPLAAPGTGTGRPESRPRRVSKTSSESRARTTSLVPSGVIRDELG